MAPTPEDIALAASHRQRVMDAMGGGVLLLAATPERLRSYDIAYAYRPDSDFHHLTAFAEPEAVCMLAPEATERFVLFVRPRDPEREIWTGARAGVEGARATYGADAAHKLDDLEQVLPRFLEKAPTVFHSVLRDDALATRILALIRRAQEARPRTGHGPTAIRDPGELLHEMRLRKTPGEIARMRRAAGVACEGHRSAMCAARPGMKEFEVEALIDYTFRRLGAAGPAYPSIVASGPNATVLHHATDDRPLGAEELLLVDAGAEYAGYCSDVTRTFPIGPRYSGAARDLYQLVLAAQLAAVQTVAPGTTLDAVHRAALTVLVDGLLGLGLLRREEGVSVDDAIERELHKRFYMHRTSHWIGRDVHDVGTYARDGVPRPLEPGMVLTVEPGLYVPADADDVPAPFRGIGIRIEDDVLVTETGHEVLSVGVPKLPDEVEALRAAATA